MKHKRILALLLSLILIFSVFGASCAKEPAPSADESNDEPTEENGVPSEPKAPTVTYRYKYVGELVPYEQVGMENWWHLTDKYFQMTAPTVSVSQKTEEWSEDLLPEIKPNSTVEIIKSVPYTYIHVSSAVFEFLESGDRSPKNFVLLSVDVRTDVERIYLNDIDIKSRDELLIWWCGAHLIDGEIIGKTGHVSFNARARDLDQINQLKAYSIKNGYYCPIGEILVCFADEFVGLYGVTFEEADILIEKGHLDMWCMPTVENSPLYGLCPELIAAYLIEHPEILEE